jgi:Uma2 family endonuclease
MQALATAPTAGPKFLTAEQYLLLPESAQPDELVRGVIVAMSRPKTRHGYYMTQLVIAFDTYVRPRKLGRVVCGDAGVVTERGPDTVRGPDVAYYSYARVPAGELPDGYWPVPELVAEVRSPTDRLGTLTAKVGEYLEAGVKVVCVLDPQRQSLAVYSSEEFPRVLSVADELTLPEVFTDFRVPIRQLFE